MALDLYSAPVNNVGIDPLQGFDFEVWCLDAVSGNPAWFGRFQSLTLSIRDATETYLELGQRIPIYLNGEVQIAWVLEQGLVDMSFVLRTFGLKRIARDQIITRGPRFQIAFDANAAELDNTYATNDAQKYRLGQRQISPFTPYGQNTSVTNTSGAYNSPKVKGRYELQRCKVDSVSLGIMPGRRVAAVRWEGVAEGITWVEQTLQAFKNNLSNPNFERTVSGSPSDTPSSYSTPSQAK